jgi:hypothetical protein
MDGNQRSISETDEFMVLHDDKPLPVQKTSNSPVIEKPKGIKDEIKKVINPAGKKDQ